MPCRDLIKILIDTTGTTYTFYEIEKRKETIKEKTRRQTGRKKERKIKAKTKRNNLSCPPPAGEVANIEKKRAENKIK